MTILRDNGPWALCVPLRSTLLKARRRAFRASFRSVFALCSQGQADASRQALINVPLETQPVRALRATAGTRHWQLRQGRQWIPVVLCSVHRGPFWFNLSFQADQVGDFSPVQYRFAIWKTTLSARVWRRLSVLLGAAQRLSVPVVRRNS